MIFEKDNVSFRDRGRYKLNKMAMGLSVGLAFGVCLMLLTWWVSIVGKSETTQTFENFLKAFFVGFKANFLGGLLGFIWGLAAGFVFGFVISMFYNTASKRLDAITAARSKPWSDKINAAITTPDPEEIDIDAEMEKAHSEETEAEV